MKENDKIPTSKVARATKFLTTGAKVGGNYVKYYSKKMVNSETSRDELDKENAADIFDSLSELKGGALKIIQMMSMDRGTLPTEYVKKFAEAQYNAPALSYPLVVKTFRQFFGKGPEEIFDTFSKTAIHAASIGQVHEATLNGKKLAVKVQYPGVADSMQSDLRMVKPLATTLFRIKQADVEHYMGEVESRLMEETDYVNELKQSIEISTACKSLKNLVFPTYYPEWSNKRILTMDWIEGIHIDQFLKDTHSQEDRNRIGQALWDFYDFQVHQLKIVHADPHPGNFLITTDGKLAILDFGCVKRLPEPFYHNFKQMLHADVLKNDAELERLFTNLQFLHPNDTPEEHKFFFDLSKQVVEMLTRPFHLKEFDFSGLEYFHEVSSFGERMAKSKEIRETKVVRGPKDGIYLGRVYFGLYHLLHELGAKVQTRSILNEQV